MPGVPGKNDLDSNTGNTGKPEVKTFFSCSERAQPLAVKI